ncbi:hypothetical protein [Spartinivicinus poritis]|uniref:Uncharacterized protein n=1 Tax=Spartinivicinus poritis TaxID=2994640 RepID=A0ABT5UBC5_9GAMM|nr:hypothetical protein [Spartinivicinus sp. A2-2]MDE1462419.1 hypothetical protein [Spartinivicinus sp. A2-2]
MSEKKVSFLYSWPFLVSLGVLLVNDLYLKEAFSNWVTGKLSDFSGLCLVSMIAFYMFPQYKKLCAVLIGSGFVLWKSQYSQPLIDMFNNIGFIYYDRVVDYADLVALAIIPLAASFAKQSYKYKTKTRLTNVLKIPIVILSIFAITGTSVIIPRHEYTIRKSSENEQIDMVLAFNLLKRIAEKHELVCYQCLADKENGIFRNNDINLEYYFNGKRGILFKVTGKPGGVFIGGSSYPEMEKLKHDLQSAFGKEFDNMEFVIKLQHYK